MSALPVIPCWEEWVQKGSPRFPKLLVQAGGECQEPTRLGRDPHPASPGVYLERRDTRQTFSVKQGCSHTQSQLLTRALEAVLCPELSLALLPSQQVPRGYLEPGKLQTVRCRFGATALREKSRINVLTELAC